MEQRLSPLRTYREFVAMQRDDAEPETFSRRYSEYRSHYGKEIIRRFFERSSDYAWFRDRYDPVELCGKVEARRAFAQGQAKVFKEEASEITMFDVATKASLDPRREAMEDEDEWEASFQFGSSYKAGNALQIWNIPPSATKSQVESQIHLALEDAANAAAAADGDPAEGDSSSSFTLLLADAAQRKRFGFETEAWLLFDDPTKAENAEKVLADARLDIAVPPAVAMPVLPWPPKASHVKERAAKMKARECQERESFRPRAKRSLVLASTSGVDDFGRGARAKRYPRALCHSDKLSNKARIISDARKATRLCALFDAKADVAPETRFATYVDSFDLFRKNALARLDVACAYLRRVHLFLYYSATQCRSEIDLLARDAPFFTRHVPASAALHDDDEEALGGRLGGEAQASSGGGGVPMDDHDDDAPVQGIIVDMDKRIDALLADDGGEKILTTDLKKPGGEKRRRQQELEEPTNANANAKAKAPMDDDDQGDDDREEEKKKPPLLVDDAAEVPLSAGGGGGGGVGGADSEEAPPEKTPEDVVMPSEEKKEEDPSGQEEARDKALGLAAKRARETWSYDLPPCLAAESEAEKAQVEEATDDFVRQHAVEEDQGRSRCAYEWCHKLFKSEGFVRKHLANRHADYLEAWLAPVKRPWMWTLYLLDDAKPLPPVRGENGTEVDPSTLVGGDDAAAAKRPPPRHQQQRYGRQGPGGGGGPRGERRLYPNKTLNNTTSSTPQQLHTAADDSQQQRPPDPRRLANYADVDAPKRPVLDLDFGVLLPPPPAKKRKSSGRSAAPKAAN